MEHIIEHPISSGTLTANEQFKTRQEVQVNLIAAAGGSERTAEWIGAYAKKFADIFDNIEANFPARFANPETCAAALEEIKLKLYH